MALLQLRVVCDTHCPVHVAGGFADSLVSEVSTCLFSRKQQKILAWRQQTERILGPPRVPKISILIAYTHDRVALRRELPWQVAFGAEQNGPCQNLAVQIPKLVADCVHKTIFQ